MLFLEPNQRFPVVLDSDKDKPAESRPTFFCKSQSGRGMIRIAEFLDEETNGRIVADTFKRFAEEILEHCVGWENVPYDFSAESIIQVMHYYEMRELLRKIMLNQHVTAEEKKS
jgi:hypothetical protein